MNKNSTMLRTFHVGRPNIGDRERLMERINDILDRRWLSNFGPYVLEFERRIEELVGVKHCIAVCNGTIALEIAIRATGLVGEVIVPSFTFVASAHALSWQGITPVFCDIHPESYTIDPKKVEELITPQTTGILGVHLWGRSCDIELLKDLATRHGLRLIYDAAHAFGCSHNGQMLGSNGEAEVFSFHATKSINSFEGGAIVTNNDELAESMRRMQNFGFGSDGLVQHLGTNGKMNEISAAMGLTSLESIDDFTAVNQHNYHMYERELNDLPGVSLVNYDASERCNYHYVVVELDEQLSGVSRDALWQRLRENRVLARRYFYPGCHRMEPYKTLYPDVASRLPHTEALGERVIVLPTGTDIDDNDIRMICGLIRSFLSEARTESRIGIARAPD